MAIKVWWRSHGWTQRYKQITRQATEACLSSMKLATAECKPGLDKQGKWSWITCKRCIHNILLHVRMELSEVTNQHICEACMCVKLVEMVVLLKCVVEQLTCCNWADRSCLHKQWQPSSLMLIYCSADRLLSSRLYCCECVFQTEVELNVQSGRHKQWTWSSCIGHCKVCSKSCIRDRHLGSPFGPATVAVYNFPNSEKRLLVLGTGTPLRWWCQTLH